MEEIKDMYSALDLNENDYKFVLKETASTQIGGRYTYEEALINDDIPFKFRSIIQLYILKEADVNTCIGMHLLTVKESDFVYQVFKQLKLKIQFYEPKEKGGYKMRSLPFPKFKKYQEEKCKKIVLQFAFKRKSMHIQNSGKYIKKGHKKWKQI